MEYIPNYEMLVVLTRSLTNYSLSTSESWISHLLFKTSITPGNWGITFGAEHLFHTFWGFLRRVWPIHTNYIYFSISSMGRENWQDLSNERRWPMVYISLTLASHFRKGEKQLNSNLQVLHRTGNLLDERAWDREWWFPDWRTPVQRSLPNYRWPDPESIIFAIIFAIVEYIFRICVSYSTSPKWC